MAQSDLDSYKLIFDNDDIIKNTLSTICEPYPSIVRNWLYG